MLFIEENLFSLVMALFFSFLLSFALTPLVKKLANKAGAIDVPDSVRHIHDSPTERMGACNFHRLLFGLFLCLNLQGSSGESFTALFYS